MRKNDRKNSTLKCINNMSSMMIFVVFLVLCLIIAAIIGIYSVKKSGQRENSGEAVTERSSEAPETHADGTADKETYGETKDSTQSDEVKMTETGIEETQSSEAQDIVFEGCGDEGVLVTMIHTGGWGDEDDPFMQYDIFIDNTTDEDISGWCVTIKVGTDAVCNNIWNGAAELENGMLTITAVDFNKTITSGTQASLGIIIEMPGTPSFEDVTFERK